MRTDWMGAIALVLSVITLAVVLSIAARPAPQSADSGPALGGLRADVSQMRADIGALRAVVERPTVSTNVDQFAAIQTRLDRLENALSGIATKFTTLCTAINSSPFSPPGGAC
ncbi:MAG: hypothetical protein ABIZ72_04410 [Candidatus Limnocylindrales bacterium]